MGNVSFIDGHIDESKTNYDRIRNMSIDEMAKFLFWLKNTYCDEDFCKIGKSGQCICFECEKICLCGLKQWLESEANEDDR